MVPRGTRSAKEIPSRYARDNYCVRLKSCLLALREECCPTSCGTDRSPSTQSPFGRGRFGSLICKGKPDRVWTMHVSRYAGVSKRGPTNLFLASNSLRDFRSLESKSSAMLELSDPVIPRSDLSVGYIIIVGETESRTLKDPETRPSLENLALALVYASRRLRRYFQAHPIKVLIDQPIQRVLKKPEYSGRLATWAIEFGSHQITYCPRTTFKGQVIADFLAELPGTKDDKLEISKPDKKDDALSKLASVAFSDLAKEMQVEILVEPSTTEKSVEAIEAR
ncbi:hypothetical protein L1987_01864 [Smallanthus sonchifolius]|uniref:Uncharacterized protein n=1 Tax=Smallanthus sonchifolius TaxID=185202 RepID=A0ACB9K681_9ASTR|nr:hypothetical protein L1987_01864 [Smallanthus sonchifolius]